MFNKDFYPSPKKVVELLTEKSHSVGVVLEPSAGKGDLADGIKEKFLNRGRNEYTLDVIEKDPELCSILQGKNYNLVDDDFLNFETNTEYDAIIMNPPFSGGEYHLLKAIKLAEKQTYLSCDIRALINAETILNPYSKERQHLVALLDRYGASIVYYDDLFLEAEKQTKVKCALIKLTVNTVLKKVKYTFDKIYQTDLEKVHGSSFENSLSTKLNENEIEKRVKDIEVLIKQYELHVALVKEKYRVSASLKYLESLVSESRVNRMGLFSGGYTKNDINEDIRNLRNSYWIEILQTEEFRKKLTNHGASQIAKYITNVASLEINRKNIHFMLMALIQNQENIILDSCVDIFDNITRYHNNEYSKNIHYYNGWSGNSAFKINSKVVYPMTYNGFNIYTYYQNEDTHFDSIDYQVRNFITDLMKMFKFLNPHFDEEFQTNATGDYENEILRFKMFKKGTIHLWFKDLDLLAQFNVYCGQQKNWIPTDEEIKKNKEADQFMSEEFPEYKQMQLTN